MSKKISLISVLFLVILYFCFSIVIDERMLFFQRGINLLIFVVCLKESYKNFKSNYIIFFFMISLFVFMYGRVNFLWLFENMKERIDVMTYIELNLHEKRMISNLSFFNLLGSYIGILFCKKLEKQKKVKFNLFFEDEKVILLISKIIIVLMFFFLYSEIQLLKLLKSLSYIDIYLYGIHNLSNNSRIIEILKSLYLGFVYLGMALLPREKNTKIIILGNYFLINLIYTIRGQRIYLLGALFFLVYYYCHIYEKKLKIYKLLVFGLILIVISNSIGEIRNKNKFERQNFYTAVKSFVYYQGITGTLLATPIIYTDLFQKTNFFILGPFFSYKLTGQTIQNEEVLKKREIVALAPKLSYTMNKDKYFVGEGIGSNYILEMYDFAGEIGVLILSGIYICIIYIISNYVKYGNSIIFKLLLILKFQSLFIAPRANYIFLNFGVRSVLLAIIMVLFLNIIKRIKKRSLDENSVFSISSRK